MTMFDPRDVAAIGDTKAAFVWTFSQPGAQQVFVNLAKFCDAFPGNVDTRLDGSIDTERTLIAQGRREAFFYLFRFLNLDTQELCKLYARTLPDQ